MAAAVVAEGVRVAGAVSVGHERPSPIAIRGECLLDSLWEGNAATPCFGLVLVLRDAETQEESFARADSLGRFGFRVLTGRSYELAVKSRGVRMEVQSYIPRRAGDRVLVRVTPVNEAPPPRSGPAVAVAGASARFLVPTNGRE